MINVLNDDFPASLRCIVPERIKLGFGVLIFIPSGHAGVWRDSGHGHIEWADAARRVTSVNFSAIEGRIYVFVNPATGDPEHLLRRPRCIVLMAKIIG